MPVFFSVYFDACRLFAAINVYFAHVPFSKSFQNFAYVINLGYDAVIVFFVLSGYVISFAAAEVEKNWANYIINRFVRIYPVAIAAITLSVFFQYMAHNIRPDLYVNAKHLENIPYYYLMSASFLNEAWWFDIKPFDNGPYWTLSFEVLLPPNYRTRPPRLNAS